MRLLLFFIFLFSASSVYALRIDTSLDPTGEARKAVLNEYGKIELKCRYLVDYDQSKPLSGNIICDNDKTYKEYSEPTPSEKKPAIDGSLRSIIKVIKDNNSSTIDSGLKPSASEQ